MLPLGLATAPALLRRLAPRGSRRPLSVGTISIERSTPSPTERVVIIGSSLNARCTTRRSRGGIGSSRTGLCSRLAFSPIESAIRCNCWRRRARYDSVSSEIGAASLIRRARIRLTMYSSASSVCPCRPMSIPDPSPFISISTVSASTSICRTSVGSPIFSRICLRISIASRRCSSTSALLRPAAPLSSSTALVC